MKNISKYDDFVWKYRSLLIWLEGLIVLRAAHTRAILEWHVTASDVLYSMFCHQYGIALPYRYNVSIKTEPFKGKIG